MDASVRDAIARWPDVPAVYGWLSLDARGRWRLHPQGQAAQGGAGESITNAQILGFINRNYERDDKGRWFFQNGPQRVFLRLDAAPYVLRLDDDDRALRTHTDIPVTTVTAWWLDDAGHLYAMAAQGPGIVLDRDLAPLMERLTTTEGRPLLESLEHLAPSRPLRITLPGVYGAAPLHQVARDAVPATLGFQANPTA